jgi:hypothetical protein
MARAYALIEMTNTVAVRRRSAIGGVADAALSTGETDACDILCVLQVFHVSTLVVGTPVIPTIVMPTIDGTCGGTSVFALCKAEERLRRRLIPLPGLGGAVGSTVARTRPQRAE